MYVSFFNSHASIDRLDFDLDAAANFAAVVKAEGRKGVQFMRLVSAIMHLGVALWNDVQYRLEITWT